MFVLRPRYVAAIVFACTVLGSVSAQQLQVTNTGGMNNPTFLAQSIFGGGGIVVTNVTFSGNNNSQIGYYSTGTTAIGSSSGVVISTGNITSVPAANTATNISGSIGASVPTDADLLTMANGEAAFDWFILEFDVIPVGDELNLQYIFASEEYGEYVCSAQADIFGILISGNGISGPFQNGAELISLVPSTAFPSGINSINDAVVGQFGTAGGCLNGTPSAYYHDNIDSLFEFDGYSSLMTATQAVTCDSVYHVRIIIADIDTDGFDSGIFLPERGMFSNGPHAFGDVAFNDTTVAEGCRPFYVTVYNAAGFGAGTTLNLNIGGTATNGVDYTNISTSFVFTAADSILYIPIVPIQDGITEGNETVIIRFDLTLPCGRVESFTFTVVIIDGIPLVVTGLSADQSICAGTPVNLNVNVSGGFAPYTIGWNGVVGNNFNDTPLNDITYVAEVSDAEGCYWTGSFFTDVNPIPIVNAGPDLTVCKNAPTTLGVSIDGGAGATYLWTPSAQLNSGALAYPVLNPVSSATYTITVTSAAGCTASDQVAVTVLPIPTADAGPDQTITYLQGSANLSGAGSGSGTPVWSPDFYLTCTACLNTTANPTSTTTYGLTITGSNGCAVTDYVTVNVEIPTDVFIPSAFSPNGDGNNDLLFVRCYTMDKLNFRVYDTWGVEVFQTFDATIGWDGKVNGTDAAIGLYVYIADVVFVNGAGSKTVAGEINLVR